MSPEQPKNKHHHIKIKIGRLDKNQEIIIWWYFQAHSNFKTQSLLPLHNMICLPRQITLRLHNSTLFRCLTEKLIARQRNQTLVLPYAKALATVLAKTSAWMRRMISETWARSSAVFFFTVTSSVLAVSPGNTSLPQPERGELYKEFPAGNRS